MRLLLFENNLRERLGHFLNCTLGLSKAARATGVFDSVHVYCHKRASREVRRITGARPVFRHVTWRRLQPSQCDASIRKFGGAFAEDLALIDEVSADDVILVATAQENQVFGLAEFVENLPESDRPFVVLNFHVDNMTRDPAIADTVRAAFARLCVANRGRVLVTAPTRKLVNRLSLVTGNASTQLFPLPQYYGPEFVQTPNVSKSPTVAVLGRPIRRKGSRIVSRIIHDATRIDPSTRFSVQASISAPRMLALARLTNVSVSVGGMSTDQYYRRINNADIVLMPYCIRDYDERASGIFADCAAFGKVAVVPDRTWMARQIERGYASGTIFDPGSPDDQVLALRLAVIQLSDLLPEARRRRHYWRISQSADAYMANLRQALRERGVDLPASNDDVELPSVVPAATG